MILILSDEDDFSTNIVIDWLLYNKVEFVRINRTSNIEINYITIDNKNNVDYELIIDKKITIKYSEIDSYWYRRGFIKVGYKSLNKNDTKLRRALNNYLANENEGLVQFLYLSLRKKKRIGSVYDNKINKLNTLLLAKESGFQIPKTLITNKRNKIMSYYEKNRIISKAISNGFNVKYNGSSYGGYTSLIDIPEQDVFPITLFQELIRKKYELRIVFIKENIYSSAIFSQNDRQTEIDFRLYNYSKPNRVVPYILPNSINNKLKKFIRLSKLTSGSVDLLVSEDNEFIFLEVNPVGQFAQVSTPCNYYIEESFAYILKHNI